MKAWKGVNIVMRKKLMWFPQDFFGATIPTFWTGASKNKKATVYFKVSCAGGTVVKRMRVMQNGN